MSPFVVFSSSLPLFPLSNWLRWFLPQLYIKYKDRFLGWAQGVVRQLRSTRVFWTRLRTPRFSAFPVSLRVGCCERWRCPLLQQKVWKEWTGRGNEWMGEEERRGGGRWRLDEGGRDRKGLEEKVF